MSTENQKQLIQLPPNELLTFDYASTRFDARIAQGVKPEDLLAPAFWAHHALKLKPLDEIRAHAEDGTWLAYYVVLDCSRTWAKVQLLSMHHLTTADVSQSQASDLEVKAFIEQHRVVHRGPRKWSVVRNGDGAVLAQDIAEKDQAVAWLDKHASQQVTPAAPEHVTA